MTSVCPSDCLSFAVIDTYLAFDRGQHCTVVITLLVTIVTPLGDGLAYQ